MTGKSESKVSSLVEGNVASADAKKFVGPHLLSIQDVTSSQILHILSTATKFLDVSRRQMKKIPSLRGRTIINLFMENSTRTRVSFEIAGKRLSADTINVGGSGSSAAKGETILDTAKNLMAMRPDIIVVRHEGAGVPALLSKHVDACVINAGDGAHEHPTQALLDCATILREKGSFEGLVVTIVGDIEHSRVARSNVLAMTKLGAQVRLCGPRTLLPQGMDCIVPLALRDKVSLHYDLPSATKDADVIMMLRIQNERIGEGQPRFASTREYSQFYGLSLEKLSLAKDDAIVMHPGPVNWGVEMDPNVVEGGRSVILDQVEMGVAVRMAVLYLASTSESELAASLVSDE